MKRYLLAIAYDGNKPDSLILGNFPWNGIYSITLSESLQYKDSIENLGITDNLDLVGYSGELSRYSAIDINTGNVIRSSLVVIAESENYQGNVYLVTDGFSEPTWKSIPDIESYIQRNGSRIANAKIVKLDGCSLLRPINGELDHIDFREYQIEYRKYLKNKKEEAQKTDGT